jgi:gliding motility-associated-like protein
MAGHAQDCPTNIDFESGTFDGWTCYTGSVAASGGQNIITLFQGGPESNRHTIMSPNSGLDMYGNFPVNCPNGSGYSIKLGNNQGGGQAEGVSYEFTIPADKDVYNIIYHYAVVFQDPDHLENEQPRMQIEVLNVTDNTTINCSSFAFHPYGSTLPGFIVSSVSTDDTPVWYKDWSAVSVNLNGMAGKTIRLFFKTADCTFRRHFGYAYIDVNSECSDAFTGATFCRDDTMVNVVAPYGYEFYNWYTSDFSQLLGQQQTLDIYPPPPTGTIIAVEVIPYNGYGCLDTLYAHMIDTLKLRSLAGADMLSCNNENVPLGALPKPGVVYNWEPPAGLNNPHISNPLAAPDITTNYIVTTSSTGGGCVSTDTVLVTASIIDNEMGLRGKPAYCIDSGDSSVLFVTPTHSIQWYRNESPISGAIRDILRVTQSGTYKAMLINTDGCRLQTPEQVILIESPRTAQRYPLQYAVKDIELPLQARQFGETATWTPAVKLDNALSYTPIFKGSTDQEYLIAIKTFSGCVTVDTQLVKTVDHVEIYVPSGFTPNNDGLNDLLRPLTMGVKELRFFRVYNRWGQLLYEMRGEKGGWDGRLKSVAQPSQVVVWIVEGLGLDGRVHTRKGTTALIR